MRRPCLLAALAVTAVLGPAGSASAAVTLTYSGTTIGISGSGSNETYVGFSTTFNPAGTVTVRNSSGVINASGGACAQETTVLGTTFHCPAAASTVQASYGGGNDRFVLEAVCMPSTNVALGDGSNGFEQSWTSECPPDTVAAVTGGSGSDLIHGGAGPDTLAGGGGNDELRGGGGDDTIDGDDGSDRLQGDDGHDVVRGSAGDDRLQGGDGNDALDGGEGNDLVGQDDPNPGADDPRGGPGFDEAWFPTHAYGIAVTLDEQANDGVPGEGDNVHGDFEKFVLTPGDDVFVGSPGRDVVDGWNGNDLLRGADGDDELVTGGGDDQLFGDGGDDLLIAGGGNDLVDGGAGRDSLFGDYRECSVYSCPAGADRLFARDGELDTVSCGAGADVAQLDDLDVTSGDGFQTCESIDRSAPRAGGPAAPGGPKAPGTGVPPSTVAPFSGAKLTGARRQFRLRLTLPRAATVSVTVTRSGARKALGRISYKAKAGRFSRTIRSVRGKRLRRGTYLVVIEVGSRSQKLKVKIR